MPEKTVIIGIGNTIKCDDGVGVYALRALEGKVPAQVQLVEGTIYCADMLPHLEDCRKLIFIDGIDAGDEPGAVFRFTPEQVKDRRPLNPLSVHDYGIYDLIMASELLGHRPEEITIYAVQVGVTGFGERLTPEVAEAIPKVCALIEEELAGAAG